MTLNNTLTPHSQYLPLRLSLSGNLLTQENARIGNLKELYREAGDRNHQYYRTELNSLRGPAGIAGLYDLFATCFMWFNERGAAPITNFLISIADYAQVFIARTKLLGDPDQNNGAGTIAKQRRVGAMAWTQVLAGVGGLGSFVKDLTVRDRESNNNPISKKLSLSISSLFASLTMLTTYSEKMITATTSKGKEVGGEIKGIALDANNDIRAAIEYLVMSIYPWVSQIKPVKKSIDLLVPIFALRDGMENFIHDGISKVFINEKNFSLSTKVKNFFKAVLFINEESNKTSKGYIPRIFCSNWFLGIGKFRDSFLGNIYELLGCKNIPKVNLAEENGKEMLILQTPGKVLEDFIEPKPTNRQNNGAPITLSREAQPLLVASSGG